jgi:hypothetical protein
MLEIQTNCEKGFGRKLQLNAFKLGPITYGTLDFNDFLSYFGKKLRYHVYKNE